MSAKNVQDLYPLTPMQQGMMFHTLEDPGSGVYVEQLRLELSGLAPEVMRRAWEDVLERHAALRASVVGSGRREPGQVVWRSLELPWEEHDLRDADDAEQGAWLEAFLDRDRRRGFDLQKAPLHRLTLIRRGDDRWGLVWTLHHLVLDGWSGGLVLADVLRCYAARARGEAPAAASARPFRDYVVWLRRQDLAAAEAHWRETLAGLTAATPLGCEDGATGERGGIESYSEEELRLTAAESDALRRAAARFGVTVGTLFQGAWALLLGRTSGDADVVFGSVVSGRPAELPGVESMVGMFVNTLPVRVQLSPAAGLGDWLRSLQAAQSEQRRFEHSPLWQVQQWSDVVAGSPLFESLLAFENQPGYGLDALAGSGLTVEVTPPFDRTGYPLMLLVMPAGTMRLRVTYDDGRFQRAGIARRLGHLRRLLEGMCEEPERRLGQLDLLGTAERRLVLEEWNESARDFGPAAGLHALFLGQAERTPEAVAVRHGGETRTYRELAARAHRLAHHLGALGVGPDDRVGLMVERSPAMVEGLLGILAAGAAYVPLDPAYPGERLAVMLADAAPAALVVHAATRELAAALADGVPAPPGVCLDGDAGVLAGRPAAPPAVEVGPQHLAYVLFTSGSTGRPKGVAMPHGPLVNLIRWQLEDSAVGAGETTLQFAPLSFDVSCQEIFATLAAGGTLELVSEALRRDPEALLELLAERSVARLFLPYVALRQLAAAAAGGAVLPAGLREVITAGEQPQVDAVLRRFFERLPECLLVNQYGPTECHVVSSYTLEGPPAAWPARPPIGRPVANARLYVLDPRLRPVPPGVPGELWLGGAALARGYLGGGALTAARFAADPFAGDARARLYRTGDLARWRDDGAVELLGRADHQVKVRGFRVEPEEIEAVLGEHPDVRLVAVVARAARPGEIRLVAFQIAAAEAPSAAELRAFAAARLPDHMVPAAFVDLPRLPLTPSGKLDRRALRSVELAPDALHRGAAPPRGPVEEALVELLAEVLGSERPGVHDDFFELGGHSLLATQLVARVRAVLKVELPLRRLFERPTAAALAAAVEDARGARPAAPPLVRRAPPVSARRELSYAQQRLWLVDRMGAGAAYNMPWAYRLEGELDVGVLWGSLAAVVRRHEVLRTRFPSLGGRPVQEVLPALPLALPVVDLSGLGGQVRDAEVRRLHRREAETVFDLAAGPLLRPRLVRLAPQLHAFFLSFHHIVFDGWSLGVLTRELAAGYRALAAGEAPRLPELPVQVADFAEWQNGWLAGEVLERQLDYWRGALAGLGPLRLPADRPRPAVQTYRGASVPLALDGELVRALRALARRRGVTLAMTLLASFQVLLGRASGQDDVAVGSPIAGRTHREIEDLIGFFVNTLVLRGDLSEDPPFADFLGRVQEMALAAYEHQDLPFERLVEELDPERDASRNPLFQVVFALHNAPSSRLELPRLTIAPFGSEDPATRFDLELHLWDSAGALRGGFTYNRDLWQRGSIERLAGHLCTLLAGIVAAPEAPLSRLPLLAEAERRQLLEERHGTPRAFPVEGCLHELFARRAAARPQAVAATCGGESLRYGELDRRANQLAHRLGALGVTPGDLVGLALGRDLDLVVAILAVLKAGAAYVPLDLANPAERIAFILEDTGLRVLVTASDQLTELPPTDARLLCLDRERESLAAEPTGCPEGDARPADLAYVIYTSGSTGKPKGVLVEHRSVVRLFTATEAWFGFGEEDVWSLFHSPAFDFSVWELWGALLYGGRLVVVPFWVSRSPEDFYRLLVDEGVTVLNQTPSAFRQLIGAARAAAAPEGLALEWVIFGGEALELASLEPWMALCGDRRPRLVNMYGITETTVHVTFRELSRADLASAPGSVVGRPIPDLSLYVLDRHRQPVPIGFPGELWVGGAGVARGYLDRPQLTEERFVPDPFSDRPGARLYRTGDVGRFLADGDLEHLGRNDDQVKVRGYRIELGEVEAALGAHPWVREAAVTLRGAADDRRLVGYVVADAAAAAAEGSDLVDHWQALYDETYGEERAADDPGFDIVGWNSSYTGEPIPVAEMRQWVEETVEWIRAGAPRRVLEIGCGTGLLLVRVAPCCEEVVATDFSQVVLDRLGRHLEATDLASRVRLSRRAADDFTDLPARVFDTVVLNSVAQYFPDVGYLMAVVAGAVERTAPGGRVLLGDLRHLGLHEAYHASVGLHRADDATGLSELGTRVGRSLAQEEELVIDPELFLALPGRLPRVGHVEIALKRGAAGNELTRFRYQVTLHVEPAAETAPQTAWTDWEGGGSLARLRRELAADGPPSLGLHGVPNARTLDAVAAAEALLHDGDRQGSTGELRRRVRERAAAGIEPAALVVLAGELGYEATLSWARPTADGAFDVLLTRRGETAARLPMPRLSPRPWASYANQPLAAKMTRQLAPRLRAALERSLPAYMVPSAFVILESLPLTANGKLERRALPDPEGFLNERRDAYAEPATATERSLAEIWSALLGLARVGRDDHFFELGGHSLLAAQLASRVRDAFGVELALRQIFETPRLASLGEHVDALQWVRVSAAESVGASSGEEREGGVL